MSYLYYINTGEFVGEPPLSFKPPIRREDQTDEQYARIYAIKLKQHVVREQNL